MLSNTRCSTVTEERENDLQAAERLTSMVAALAVLGTADQRNGRSRIGQFVGKPPAIEAQLLLEVALKKVAQRIKERE